MSRRVPCHRGLSLVELLVATTILAIVALGAGAVFGKLYATFGRNTATMRAVRLGNELVSRIQARSTQNFTSLLPDCEQGEDDPVGPFCYMIDLYRDTSLGGNPQTANQVTREARLLNTYTAWMDVRTVKRRDFSANSSADSDWLIARQIKIRVFRAEDVFCGDVITGDKVVTDVLGLPKVLRGLAGIYTGGQTAKGELGGLKKVVASYHYDDSASPCYDQGHAAAKPTPAPLAEVVTAVVLNPRALVSRRGTEYTSYDFTNGLELPLQPYLPGVSGSLIGYYDAEAPAGGPRNCVENVCSFDLYKEAYPGILYEPPPGWIPDPSSGVITFTPNPVTPLGGAAAPPDPVIRYVLWTYSPPEFDLVGTLADRNQFRHRLRLTTFTDRLVDGSAKAGFLNALPQAAGRSDDNYLPLWISVTSLPDASGKCRDELAPNTGAASELVSCGVASNLTQVVLPIFPGSKDLPYEATVNLPPGPAARLPSPVFGRQNDVGLPNVLGLPGAIRQQPLNNDEPLSRLASPTTPRYARPHLVHIRVPLELMRNWPVTSAPLNLSIARVRFVS